MKSLLDTCTVAEIRKADGAPAVARVADEDLYLSVLTMGEIAKGVALLAPGPKKAALGTWLDGLRARFADRILGVDLEAAQIWGELTARARRSGVTIPAADGLLAANGLRDMTRNSRHFEASGVLVVDPWRGG